MGHDLKLKINNRKFGCGRRSYNIAWISPVYLKVFIRGVSLQYVRFPMELSLGLTSLTSIFEYVPMVFRRFRGGIREHHRLSAALQNVTNDFKRNFKAFQVSGGSRRLQGLLEEHQRGFRRALRRFPVVSGGLRKPAGMLQRMA